MCRKKQGTMTQESLSRAIPMRMAHIVHGGKRTGEGHEALTIDEVGR